MTFGLKRTKMYKKFLKKAKKCQMLDLICYFSTAEVNAQPTGLAKSAFRTGQPIDEVASFKSVAHI